MRKVRVVEARIFDGIAGFERGVEPFVGFGLPVGCGGVFALDPEFLGLGERRIEIVSKPNCRYHGKPPLVGHGESHPVRVAQQL